MTTRVSQGNAVKGMTGWSQSGTLVAGEIEKSFIPLILQPAAHVVSMQVNFPDDADSVHTIMFGVGPATEIAQNQQQPQPTPTPPNPIVVDPNGNTSPAAVTNGSPTVLFPPPSANAVVPGAPQTLPAAGQLLQFSNQPNSIYTVLSSVAPSTVTLTKPFTGTSQLRAGVSVLANAPIPFPPGPANTQPQAIDVVAVIQFTVQGNKVQRIISVGNGTSISGPGEALQVQVYDNTLRPSSQGYQYNVSIQVTPGLRAAVNQPAVLSWTYPPTAVLESNTTPVIQQPFWVQIVPPSPGFLSVPIPQNAGIVSYSLAAIDGTHPGTTPVLIVGQEDASGDSLSQTFMGPPVPGGFIPIVPGATSLLISNETAGGDILSVSILWGIDG